MRNLLFEKLALLHQILLQHGFRLLLYVISHGVLSHPYILLEQLALLSQNLYIDLVVHYYTVFATNFLADSLEQTHIILHLFRKLF